MGRGTASGHLVTCLAQPLAQHLRITEHAFLPVGRLVSDQDDLHGTTIRAQ